MMMSLLERLNHAFSGGIMFVQPTAETSADQYNERVWYVDYEITGFEKNSSSTGRYCYGWFFFLWTHH